GRALLREGVGECHREAGRVRRPDELLGRRRAVRALRPRGPGDAEGAGARTVERDGAAALGQSAAPDRVRLRDDVHGCLLRSVDVVALTSLRRTHTVPCPWSALS